MPYTIEAICPCCKCEAHSKTEIDKLFGWRIQDNQEQKPQSYCRKCRIAHCIAGQPCKVNNSLN